MKKNISSDDNTNKVLNELAEELAAASRKIRKLAEDDITGCFQLISSGMEGEVAEQIVQKGRRRQDRILQLAKEIKKTSTMLFEYVEISQEEDLYEENS